MARDKVMRQWTLSSVVMAVDQGDSASQLVVADDPTTVNFPLYLCRSFLTVTLDDSTWQAAAVSVPMMYGFKREDQSTAPQPTAFDITDADDSWTFRSVFPFMARPDAQLDPQALSLLPTWKDILHRGGKGTEVDRNVAVRFYLGVPPGILGMAGVARFRVTMMHLFEAR